MLILTHEFSTTQLNEDYNEIYIVTEAFSTSADDSQFIFSFKTWGDPVSAADHFY